MSHSKVEASRTRRVFLEEFKQDAVRHVVSENYTMAAAARAVGVGEHRLRTEQPDRDHQFPFENWTEVLGSERLSGAALDWLTQRCQILETKGESYRLQDAKRRRNGG